MKLISLKVAALTLGGAVAVAAMPTSAEAATILTLGDAYYLVHHYYDADDQGRSKLQVRPIVWIEDWPTAGEPLGDGD